MSFLDFSHRVLGRSRMLTRWALRVRNQCNAVIWRHLNDGPDATRNGEEWLVSLVAPTGATFVDVGAHVGKWTRLVLDKMPGARAGLVFEPTSRLAESLREKFASVPGIVIVEAAASDELGTATFYEEAGTFTETSSLVSGYSLAGAVATTVRVTTVDEEASQHGIEYIDLLKMDCEGYDLHALRGARRLLAEQRIGVIQFEYNTPWAEVGSTLAAALRLLRSHEYEVYLLKGAGLYTFDYERYREFFEYANFVAISKDKLPLFRSSIRGDI